MKQGSIFRLKRLTVVFIGTALCLMFVACSSQKTDSVENDDRIGHILPDSGNPEKNDGEQTVPPVSDSGAWISNWYKVKVDDCESSECLRIRSSAGTDGKIIGHLNNRDYVHISDIEGDFGKFDFNGVPGYVGMDYLEPYDLQLVIDLAQAEKIDLREFDLYVTPNSYSEGAPEGMIKNSPVEPYQTATAAVSRTTCDTLAYFQNKDHISFEEDILPCSTEMGFTSLFYRLGEDDEWRYFNSTQGDFLCGDFNTADLQKAFFGYGCFIADDGEYETSTVTFEE